MRKVLLADIVRTENLATAFDRPSLTFWAGLTDRKDTMVGAQGGMNGGRNGSYGFWRYAWVCRSDRERSGGFQHFYPAMQTNQFASDNIEGDGHDDEQGSLEVDQGGLRFGLSDGLGCGEQ